MSMELNDAGSLNQLARQYLRSAEALLFHRYFRDSLPLFRQAVRCQLQALDSLPADVPARAPNPGDALERLNDLIHRSENRPHDFSREEAAALADIHHRVSEFITRADRLINDALRTPGQRRRRKVVCVGLPAAIAAALLTAVLANWSTRLGTGLRGDYYTGQDFSQPAASRIDRMINFNFDNPLSRPPGITARSYSVHWTGLINAPVPGEYIFILENDDGARLWIDGELLIDDWNSHGLLRNEAAASLAAGWLPIRLDYYQADGPAGVALRWRMPGQAEELVSNTYLRPYKR